MRKKPLSDQVLVVTGASSGLGRAIARRAGARGAKVVVTARNAEALDNCVREIERLGGQALAVPADHAVQDEVAQVVEQALDRFGRIDTYVANAIVTVYAEVEQLEPEELRRVMDDRSRRTTLWTTLRLRRSLVPAVALLAAGVTAAAPRVRKLVGTR